MKKTAMPVIIAALLAVAPGFSYAENAPAAAVNGGAPSANAEGGAENEYRARISSKDPFRPLVNPPAPVVVPENKVDKVPSKPLSEIKPLALSVTFIVGTDIRRFAVISLNGRHYEMKSGDEAEHGLFKVIEVGERHVVVFDSKVMKERRLVLSE